MVYRRDSVSGALFLITGLQLARGFGIASCAEIILTDVT